MLMLSIFLAGGEKEPATFAEVETEILGLSCAFSSCHGASAGAGGLVLTGEGDLDRLVNVASTVLAEETLVIPGDSENSYLVKKVMGAEGIDGDIMAPGTGVSPEQLELLRSWIDEGALDN